MDGWMMFYLHQVVDFLDDVFGRLQRLAFQFGVILRDDEGVQVQIVGHCFVLLRESFHLARHLHNRSAK